MMGLMYKGLISYPTPIPGRWGLSWGDANTPHFIAFLHEVEVLKNQHSLEL